jgi:hypothetical protein
MMKKKQFALFLQIRLLAETSYTPPQESRDRS